MTILIVLVVVLFVAIVVMIFNLVVDRRDDAAREPERWAGRHGLELTERSRPWVASYLRTGRDLRQICGVGGLVVAASVTAATGLDLYVSGLVWVLLGYLVGCLWAELALTRVPTGTRRAASLVTRRLADYLPRRMQIAEVVVPVTALALGAVVVLAHLETRRDVLAPGELPPTGVHLVSPYATDQIVRQGALTATVLAPLIMVVVWRAQRYLIGRPQPVVDPSLIAADDALRSSSTHLLGASGLAAGCLLIGSQLGYLTTVTSGWVQGVAIVALVASFAAAWVLFRWRNGPWQVRHPASGSATADGPAPGEADGRGSPSGWPGASMPTAGTTSVPTAGAASVPTAGTTSVPTAGATSVPTAGAASVSTAGATSVPTAGAASVTAVASAPATTQGAATDAPAWTIRRSPVPLAVGAIVAIALAGWALRTWGPINPAVTLVNSQQSVDGTGAWTASVLVVNEARAPIEIVAVSTSLDSSTGASGVTDHQVTDVSISEQTADGGQVLAARPVPATIPGGARAVVTAALSGEEGCAPGIGLLTFDLRVTYRTESGREVTRVVPVPRADLPACVPPLPTGPQPIDPVAAEAAVRSSFAVVYDPTAGAERLDLIDDPRGVADTTAAAVAGPYGGQVASATATIGEVSFDRPDHAWFHFVLSAGFGTRTGEAVLVDGTWKIARSTVCADLALADVTCPPVPG